MSQFMSVIVLIVTVVLATYQIMLRSSRRKMEVAGREIMDVKTALVTAQADFEARQQELRFVIGEARQREDEAKAKIRECEAKLAQLDDQLRTALEEKGRLQNEEVRVQEAKSMLVERDSEVRNLQIRIVDLEQRRIEAVKDAEAADRRASELIAHEKQKQAEILSAKDEQITKLEEFIGNAREVLMTEFKALSADALKDASTQLTRAADEIMEKHGEQTVADIKLHQQHIEILLKPVEETIRRLDKHVEDSNLSRTRAEALLDDQVKRLASASESLTNALQKPVVRGSWGEMTLENALESAGLEAEIDFILQHHTDGEEGRKRTDAIINLPKGRKLIIDSKNLMESYIALANASGEAERSVLALAHSKILKSHIKALSGKEYWRRYEGLDCVILFIPHDGMYHAAIQDESELIREASEKRVFISNPMTLMPLLKAIRFVLNQERLNKSAEEISKVGTELYAAVTRFATNLSLVGDRLKSTVQAYNDALPALDRFIVSKSRKLKQLGSAKGADPETPEPIELEPRLLNSPELRRSGESRTAPKDPAAAEIGTELCVDSM